MTRPILFLFLCLVNVEAFSLTTSFGATNCHLYRHVTVNTFSPTTCLYAGESNEEVEQDLEVVEDELNLVEDELNLPSEDPTDILNSPAFLKRKIEVLKSDIAASEAKKDVLNESYMANKEEWEGKFDSLEKEYANIRNRMSSQSKEGSGQAIFEVSRKMLEFLDNFDRAFGAFPPSNDEEKEIEASYKDSCKMITEIFAKNGIKEVETVGKEFDYEFHQAVMTRPDEVHEEGFVCEELAKGYVREDGKLIRAAMVVVAA